MSDRNKNKNVVSLKLTSSNNDSGMVEPDEQKEIICPYDASHCIRPARLANHLLRCARNHQGSNLVRCPFNSCHLQQPDQLQVSLLSGLLHSLKFNVFSLITGTYSTVRRSSFLRTLLFSGYIAAKESIM